MHKARCRSLKKKKRCTRKPKTRFLTMSEKEMFRRCLCRLTQQKTRNGMCLFFENGEVYRILHKIMAKGLSCQSPQQSCHWLHNTTGKRSVLPISSRILSLEDSQENQQHRPLPVVLHSSTDLCLSSCIVFHTLLHLTNRDGPLHAAFLLL